MVNIEKTIVEVLDYGRDKNLIEERDRIYVINRLLNLLRLQDFKLRDFNIKNKREI